MPGFIRSVLSRFGRADDRLAYLERTLKSMSKRLDALPLASSFATGVGAYHPLANARDLVMVQVQRYDASVSRWVAKKIVYQAGAGGFAELVNDPDDTDELWLWGVPGQVLFPGARGFAAYVGELSGTVIHAMIAGEVTGITARLTAGADSTDPDTYPWTEITDGSFQALTHESAFGAVTLGLARARDSKAYDPAVTATRQEFSANDPVRLYWDYVAEEMWFAGGVDPTHGTCT